MNDSCSSSDVTSSTSSLNSRSTSSDRNNRRCSLPPRHQNHAGTSSKSRSDRLPDRRIENRTSDVERSVSSDSGCNSCGSDSLLDGQAELEERARLRTAETSSCSDVRVLRNEDGNSANDSSGYLPAVLQPNHASAAVSVRVSSSGSEIRRDIDSVASKKPIVLAGGGEKIVVSAAAESESAKSDTNAAVHLSSPSNSVWRRASSPHAQNCRHRGAAADGRSRHDSSSKMAVLATRRHDSSSRVAVPAAPDRGRAKKPRRTSTTTLSRPEPDGLTRTRRRHSFMLPNGSDIHPGRCFGVAWRPTVVVVDGLRLSDAAAEPDGANAGGFLAENKSGGAGFRAEKEEESFRELGALKDRAQLVGASKPSAVLPPSSDDCSEPAESDSCSAAGFRSLQECGAGVGLLKLARPELTTLGVQLRSGLQLSDAERARIDVGSSAKDGRASPISGEGSSADPDSPGAGPANPPPPGEETESPPPPPAARSPPSYHEALLQQALRRAGLAAAAAQCQLGACHGPAHLLMTSSTPGDVIVPPEVGSRHSEVGGRRRAPPPHYGPAHLLMTSSTRGGDVVVTSSVDGNVVVPQEVGSLLSEVGCRGRAPPPPYQLRPRRPNCADDSCCHSPCSGRSAFNGDRHHSQFHSC